MKKLILMLLMCVFTTAATSSLFAQTSKSKTSVKTKTEQPIKRYNNSSSIKYPSNKKKRVNKVQPKSTPSKKSKIKPKAKKD